MKQLYLLLAICLAFIKAEASVIVGYEYFWDSDPGIGNATSVGGSTFVNADSVNITKTISTAGLSSGTHYLYIRTKDSDGKWSLAEAQQVNVVALIVEAEFFWDTDPGIGNGIVMASSTFVHLDSVNLTKTFTTAGLSAGVHYLYVRTRDSEGKWSLVEAQQVNVAALIVEAEFFWDTDPGIDNGIVMAGSTFIHLDSVNLNKTFSTANLSAGIHYLYVRTRDSEGKWSLAEAQQVNVVPIITRAEYFWDTDPGIGNGLLDTNFVHADSINKTKTFNTTGLSAGIHYLFVRTKDDAGKWSLAEGVSVNVVPLIVDYEYFWDTDPGIGNGFSYSIPAFPHLDSVNHANTISTTGLIGGYHTLYVRTKDSEGKWGLSEASTIYIQPIITQAEFFWDADPGIDNATNIPFGTQLDSVNVNIPASLLGTSALSAGIHHLYVRTKDSGNHWSLSEGMSVEIKPYLVKGEYFLNTDPGIGNGNVAFTAPVGSPADSINGSYNIGTTGLPYGTYYHYLRTMDNFGKWSLTEPRAFNLMMLITAVEYFIDIDPGVGSGINIPIAADDTVNITNYSIPTTSLPAGWHNLYIRAKNDANVWTVIDIRPFYIQAPLNPSYTTNTDIEYFIDTDPGVGAATNIPIADADTLLLNNQSIVTTGLSAGFHQLYLRAKNNAGVWSVIDSRPFVVDEPPPPVTTITKLEYFYDTDPGVGSALDIPITGAPNDTVVVNINKSVPCLANGTHYMWLRAKNNLGVWSVVDYDTLTVGGTMIATPITSTGPDTVCSPSTVTLYADSASGIAYQWLNNGTAISGAVYATYTATVSGNYSLRQTCGSIVVTSNIKNVIVNFVPFITYCPTVPFVSNAMGLCSSVVIFPPATAIGSSPLPFITYSQNSGTSFPVGSTTVYAIATNLCGVDSCQFNVEVNDAELPVISNCPATVSVNSASTSCNAVATWTAPTASDNCGIQTFTSTHSSGSVFPVGTTTVTYTATDIHGNVQTCSFIVVVTDNELPSITCPATITTCNTSPALGTPTTFDNCGIDTVYNNAPVVFPQGLTVVTWTVEDVNGNINTCLQNVTIQNSSIAADSITSSAGTNICIGGNTVLTVAGGSLGSGDSWNWYKITCGGTSIGNGNSISVSPTVTTTYYVRAEGSCGNTLCTSITIVVSTSPVTSLALMPFTGMPANVCSTTVANLSIAPVSRATFYVWDAPTGSYFNGNPLNVSPFTTATPSVTITFGAPSGSLYNVGVQAGNSCGSSVRQSQKVRGLTSVPASISGSLTACANSTVTYSTAAVTGASSYLWTITGNATVSGTGTTATVTFNAGWTGGILCVAAQTTCYTSPAKCISISNTAAALGAISGTFTVCPNQIVTYSVPVSAGAASYTWTSPANSNIISGQGTNSIQVNYLSNFNASGNICVNMTSICGVTTANKCKTVAPGLPQQPASITGPGNGLCGQTVVYSCPSQGPGVTYNWTVPSGATIQSGQGSTSISVLYGTFTTGSVCVTAQTSCGSGPSRCIPVKGAPNAPSAITATPACWLANTAGVQFDANVGNITGSYTLSWTYPAMPVASYVSGAGNSSQLIMDWGTGSGNIFVTAGNGCGSATRTSTWSNSPSCRLASEVISNAINVSPNPTTGKVNIAYTSSKGNVQITVTDLAGRVVMSDVVTTVDGLNNTQLDMSKLAKGTYVLNMAGVASNSQVKVVVE